MSNLYELIRLELKEQSYQMSDIRRVSLQLINEGELFNFVTMDVSKLKNILEQIVCDSISNCKILYDIRIDLFDYSYFDLEVISNDDGGYDHKLIYIKSHTILESNNIDEFEMFVKNVNNE